jgi:hypothetical protein
MLSAVVSSRFDPNSPNFREHIHTHSTSAHHDAINTFVLESIMPKWVCLQNWVAQLRFKALPNQKNSGAATLGVRGKQTETQLGEQLIQPN